MANVEVAGFTRDSVTNALLTTSASAGAVQIADGTILTQLLKVMADGSINVNSTPGTEVATAASGAAIPALFKAMGGSDGTLLRPIKTDTGGILQVALTAAADVSDRAGRLLGVVTGTFWQATQPVSGTFWQATQPISGTVTSNQGTAAATASAWPAKVTDGTNVSAVKAASTAPVATDPALVVALSPNSAATAAQPVTIAAAIDVSDRAARLIGTIAALPTGANVIGAVTQSGIWTATPPTLTKSTQGATGFSVQNLRDAGRVGITISGYQVAGTITTETAMSLVRQADGVAAAAATSFAVTAGKRLRLQSLVAMYKQNAAAVSTLKLALRYASTTPTNASPVIAYLDLESTSATTGSMVGPVFFDFPDGFEIPATFVYSLFNLASAVTNLVTVTLVGYEY